MRRHLQQGRSELVAGWLIAVAATVVYMLTLEPSVSFWDCGEFITTSFGLMVGHPPGAPLYQLLARLFCWLSMGHVEWVAYCSNALSAVAGGLTVMILFWSLLLIMRMPSMAKQDQDDAPYRIWIERISALTGAACYCFCDTAWFSAVESEVYSLSMFFSALIIWCMLKWYHCEDPNRSPRWILLIAFLLGLSVCVHMLSLLTTPALLLLFILKWRAQRKSAPRLQHQPQFIMLCLVFFAIGLTPYLLLPIRASVNPPINEGNPSTAESFKHYIQRDQYEKAPLYPRLWRHKKNDDLYTADWSNGDTNLWGNLQYYASYQLTYMYVRYFMWNFSGRFNDRQGYGSPQNGQFITGIPFVDKVLVSTSATPPKSLRREAHTTYYLLPLLLGLIGIFAQSSRSKTAFWYVMVLFLMSGIVLSVYLNHPCYEPRERDYAYVLSFYAFCIWIGLGAQQCARCFSRHAKVSVSVVFLTLGVPSLMAAQNWASHDRSGRTLARDISRSIIGSCDQGAVLFTYGDNDTFPLWYVHYVEGFREDVRIENMGLLGGKKTLELLTQSLADHRPVYFSHYAYNQYHNLFDGRLCLEGHAYRLCDEPCDSVSPDKFYAHKIGDAKQQADGSNITNGMGRLQSNVGEVYVDEIACRFMEQHWKDVLAVTEFMSDRDDTLRASQLLRTAIEEMPFEVLNDVQIMYRITLSFRRAKLVEEARVLEKKLKCILDEQLKYFGTMPPARQSAMPFTIGPRKSVWMALNESSAD